MPPHYVKAYVKRNKNDMADAEAICEAVTRPTMRFVAVKGREQQSILMVHRTRELLIRQRTMLVNAIRAHMAEYGIVAPVGIPRVKELFAVIAGAMSVIRHGRKTNFEKNPWLGELVDQKPAKVAAVALANRIARTAWAVLVTGEPYRQPAPAEV